MVRFHFKLLLLVVLILSVSSCQGTSSIQEESPISPNSPLPRTQASPTEETSESDLQVPTPSPGFGVVTGQIVAAVPAARPFLAGDIYLAPVIHAEGEASLPFIRLKPDEDPKADRRNQQNEFVFVDVPPGNYGLIVHTPISNYLVSDGEGDTLVVEVKKNEVLDLGRIDFE